MRIANCEMRIAEGGPGTTDSWNAEGGRWIAESGKRKAESRRRAKKEGQWRPRVFSKHCQLRSKSPMQSRKRKASLDCITAPIKCSLERGLPVAEKTIRRTFPWRIPLLTALSRNPKMVNACRVANVSRNTVYTHLRKDAGFRRQSTRALDQGFKHAYREHDGSAARSADSERNTRCSRRFAVVTRPTRRHYKLAQRTPRYARGRMRAKRRQVRVLLSGSQDSFSDCGTGLCRFSPTPTGWGVAFGSCLTNTCLRAFVLMCVNARLRIYNLSLRAHFSLVQRRLRGCRWRDSNPHSELPETDFKSVASAISPHRLCDWHFTRLAASTKRFPLRPRSGANS